MNDKKLLFLLVSGFFLLHTSYTIAQKKIFRYNQTGGIHSLDPAFANKTNHVWAINQVYNRLFRINTQLETEAELADNWDISPDGTAYTFTIKKNIFFQDDACFPNQKGRELKAQDFVYSFRRILDYKTGGTGSWIFKDKVLREPTGHISDTCFLALDDYTFKIYLEKRFPAFLQILSMAYTSVIPQEAVERYGKYFSKHPVGTGAFYLREWKTTQMILEKHANYWKKDTQGNQLPYLDEVHILFMEAHEEEYRAFMDGEIDFLSNVISDVSREQLLYKDGTVKEDVKKYFNVLEAPYLNTEYVGFWLAGDEESNPFLNIKVRQAMSYAIDKEDIVNTLRHGFGYPANSGMVPIALHPFDSTKVRGYQYDLQRAKGLLKEAGYPYGNGLPAFTLYTYPRDLELATFLKRDWEAIGLKITIETHVFSTHLTKVANGHCLLFRGSWIGDYPEAENYLALFYSKNFTPLGPNKTHFSNSDFDTLFEEVHQTNNVDTIYEDYLRMDSMIMESAAVIPLYYDDLIWLVHTHVQGLEINALNSLYLEEVNIIE